jgi:hypothetical protein
VRYLHAPVDATDHQAIFAPVEVTRPNQSNFSRAQCALLPDVRARLFDADFRSVASA